MEPDDPLGDDELRAPLLPPDDRLWRHPSEVAAFGPPYEGPDQGRRRARTWAVAAVAAAFGAAAGVGVVALVGAFEGRVRTVEVVERVALPTRTLSTTAGGPAPGAARVAQGLRPAVVALTVERAGAPHHASGVVFRSDGHLLTNAHVVEGAGRISVTLAGGARADGRVVGVDTATDVAVVKVDGWSSVVSAPLGSAASLSVGQDVMAVGASGAGVVGMVSAVGRQVDRAAAPALVDLIQTNAPVTDGWSGGALVDDRGAVVGILTAVTTPDAGVAGIGFATPIEVARAVADQLVAGTVVARPWIGIEGGDLDARTARDLGTVGGAVESQVREDGPADAGGLAAGDVITSVDGVPVASMGALRILVRAHRPGDVVRLAVVRQSARRTVGVTLAERPAAG
jgi:putative serine protease PepD